MSKPVDFSKELAELEAIVAWFESGDVDLDEALTKFERGMELATTLKEYLDTVENKVEQIKQKFDKSETTAAAPAEPEDSESSEASLF